MPLAFLNGPPTFQIILDEEELAELFNKVHVAVQEEGARLLDRLGDAAVETLATMYNRHARPRLARSWKRGRALRAGDGSMRLTVYNDMEDKWIYNTDGEGNISRKYRIKGRNLIEILEYGTPPHWIVPKSSKYLEFLAPAGGHKSFFGGTHVSRGRTMAYIYRNLDRDTIRTKIVDHPGVNPDNYIRLTEQRIALRLEQEVKATIQGITSRVT